MIGTPLAAVLVVNPRAGGPAHILRLCWHFKWQKSSGFFHHTNACCFFQPEVMGIYLLGGRTLGCVVWAVQFGLGLGLLVSKVSVPLAPPPLFHATLPLYPSPQLCLVWINVCSLNTWLSELPTALFSESSGFYWFWDMVVILSMVTQGGEAFLTMPPSRLEVLWFSKEVHTTASFMLSFLQYSYTINQSDYFY